MVTTTTYSERKNGIIHEVYPFPRSKDCITVEKMGMEVRVVVDGRKDMLPSEAYQLAGAVRYAADLAAAVLTTGHNHLYNPGDSSSIEQG